MPPSARSRRAPRISRAEAQRRARISASLRARYAAEQQRRARISASLLAHHAAVRAKAAAASRARQRGFQAWLADVRAAQAAIGGTFAEARRTLATVRARPDVPLVTLLPPPPAPAVPPIRPAPPIPPPPPFVLAPPPAAWFAPVPPSLPVAPLGAGWMARDPEGEFAFNLQDVDQFLQARGEPPLWDRFIPGQQIQAMLRVDIFTGEGLTRQLAGSIARPVPIEVGRSAEESWRNYFQAVRVMRAALTREDFLAAGIHPDAVDDAFELATSGKSGEGFAVAVTRMG